MAVTPAEVLTTIAQSFVIRDKYADVQMALTGLALDQVERKIARYRRQIQRFEQKHRMNFDRFTARLRKGRTTIADEDDWLAWRAAIRLLSDWEATRRELKRRANPRS